MAAMSCHSNTNNNHLSDMLSPSLHTPSTEIVPSIVDAWLVSELCQQGLLLGGYGDYPLPHLAPQSPPLTASPPSTVVSRQSPELESPTTTPSSRIPLFPEIQKKPALKKILPKTAQCPISPSSNSSSHVNATCVPEKRKLNYDREKDEIAMKRQKNTDAARRSRLKKLMKMESLEKRVTELEADNTRLTTRIAVLESEKAGLESKDKALEDRIKFLEQQLSEAHKALTSVKRS
ncbi:hypothetical protein EC973_009344 [Apophysomyces ossiformis]|uniref:BZIP domain-containing protein n=1 Tax=Apophysomyces ossiformis TaxID=679940 RepID=A0A8H7BYL9_9FUNG|nr:hypothetical protein EC973_009344 [Apophysomyces ossiformis]